MTAATAITPRPVRAATARMVTGSPQKKVPAAPGKALMRTRTERDPAAIATGGVTLVGHVIEVDPNWISFGQNTRALPITPEAIEADATLANKFKPFAKSFRQGQIQPIAVHPDPNPENPGRFVLRAGARRLTAAYSARNGSKALDFKADDKFRILALVVPPPAEDAPADGLRMTWDENKQREEVTPIDDAAVAVMLQTDHDFTNKDIASFMGKSEAWVGTLLRLAEVPPAIQQLVADRLMTSERAAQCVGFDEEAVAAVLSAVKSAATATAKAVKEAGLPPEAGDARTRKAGAAAGAAAIADQKAAGKGTPTATRKPKQQFRPTQEFHQLFSELLRDEKVPAAVREFAGIAVEFCRNKSTAANLKTALVRLVTGDTGPAVIGTKAPRSAPGPRAVRTAPAPAVSASA